MYTQRLPELGADINEYGCALMCVVGAVSNLHPHRFITPSEVRKLYSEAKRSGVMGEHCYIEDWRGVFRLLGVAVSYHGHRPSSWRPDDGWLEVVEWRHDKLGFTHFTLGGDTPRHPFYDPWGATDDYLTSRSVAEGYVNSKRAFQILEA